MSDSDKKYAGFLAVHYGDDKAITLELFSVGTIRQISQKCHSILGTSFYVDGGEHSVLSVKEESDVLRAYLVPLSLDVCFFQEWCSSFGAPQFYLDWRYSGTGATMTPQGYAELIRYAKWLSLLQPKLSIAEVPELAEV